MVKSKCTFKLMDVILIILLSEAWVVFKAGTNQDGWFSADNLLDQVENAINIFEAKTNNFVTGLFMFDNAPSHQKRAPDALSARKMLKNPNQRWMSMKGGPRMWNSDVSQWPGTSGQVKWLWPSHWPSSDLTVDMPRARLRSLNARER